MKRGVPGHCMKCGTFRPYLQRDRIVPGYLGGSYAPDNIQWLCANCHEDKSRAEASDASRKYHDSHTLSGAERVERALKVKLGKEAARKAREARGITYRWSPSEEHRARVSAAMKCRVISAETRAKNAEKQRGKVYSAETRAKIGAASRGRVASAETRAKLSAARTGKTPSPETRAKLMGRTVSPETRAKLSAVHMGNQTWLGRKHSAETRAKMSAASKGKPKPWLAGKPRPAGVIEKMRQGLAESVAAKKALASAKPIGGIS